MIDTEKTRETIRLLKAVSPAKGLATHLTQEIDRLQSMLDALTCAEIVRSSLALQRHEGRCKECGAGYHCDTVEDLHAEWVGACRNWSKV